MPPVRVAERAGEVQTIRTARLVLEPLVVAHAEPMFALLADPSLYAYIDSLERDSVEDLRRRYLELERRTSPDGSALWLNWIVVLPGAGPIGFVQASIVGTDAWVAYLLGTRHRGRGYATEATDAMLRHVATAYGASLFRATVEAENAASAAVLHRLGFRPATTEERVDVELSSTERSYCRSVGDGST